MQLTAVLGQAEAELGFNFDLTLVITDPSYF